MENEVISQNEQAAPVETVQPPLLTQDQMNRVVASEKFKAKEAGRREAEAQYQKELEALRASQEQRNAGVSREIDANAIYQQIQEKFNAEMQERQMKDQMSQIANKYLGHVASGKANYEDFDETIKDFDPTAFPQLTYLIAGMENGADILYDISKNPTKIAMLDRLAEKNPRMAQSELLKLSKSIADNKRAISESQSQNVNEPLDRLQPSRIAGSNGKMTITDLRNQSWLRG